MGIRASVGHFEDYFCILFQTSKSYSLVLYKIRRRIGIAHMHTRHHSQDFFFFFRTFIVDLNVRAVQRYGIHFTEYSHHLVSFRRSAPQEPTVLF